MTLFRGPLKKQLTEVGKKACLFIWHPNEFSSLIKQSATLLEEKQDIHRDSETY